MNCKLLNTATMNNCASFVHALVFNFFDTIHLCPPQVTKIPPESRTVSIAPQNSVIVITEDDESNST